MAAYASQVGFFVAPPPSGQTHEHRGFSDNGIIPVKSTGSSSREAPRTTNMFNRDLIRASEIGDWCFCRRAWYLNERGIRPTLVQIEKRQAGIAYHERHGRVVTPSLRSMSIGTFALVLLLLFAVACWLTMRAN